jgi:putative FmdB family regulatory protein
MNTEVVKMPFYDLRCTACSEEFNVMAKMSEREQKLIKCPKCGSTELEAVFSNVNIVQSRKTPEMPACPNAHKCNGCCGH